MTPEPSNEATFVEPAPKVKRKLVPQVPLSVDTSSATSDKKNQINKENNAASIFSGIQVSASISPTLRLPSPVTPGMNLGIMLDSPFVKKSFSSPAPAIYDPQQPVLNSAIETPFDNGKSFYSGAGKSVDEEYSHAPHQKTTTNSRRLPVLQSKQENQTRNNRLPPAYYQQLVSPMTEFIGSLSTSNPGYDATYTDNSNPVVNQTQMVPLSSNNYQQFQMNASTSEPSSLTDSIDEQQNNRTESVMDWGTVVAPSGLYNYQPYHQNPPEPLQMYYPQHPNQQLNQEVLQGVVPEQIQTKKSTKASSSTSQDLNSDSQQQQLDRPHICPYFDICGQQFSRKHDLVRHVRIHTDDKPYKCARCHKSFTRLDALKRHEQVSEKYGGRCRVSRGRVPKRVAEQSQRERGCHEDDEFY